MIPAAPAAGEPASEPPGALRREPACWLQPRRAESPLVWPLPGVRVFGSPGTGNLKQRGQKHKSRGGHSLPELEGTPKFELPAAGFSGSCRMQGQAVGICSEGPGPGPEQVWRRAGWPMPPRTLRGAAGQRHRRLQMRLPGIRARRRIFPWKLATSAGGSATGDSSGRAVSGSLYR